MVSLKVIGLNCGTSVDGIDVALINITSLPNSPDLTIKLLSYREYPVPSPIRTQILSLCRPSAPTTLEEICDLNFRLGDLFGEAVLASNLDLERVDLISSHGQTLWHNPVAQNLGEGYKEGGRVMSTLQMAESSVISQKTGLTVVNDMRVSELARGRMGAPLSGFFEAALIRHPTKLRVSQNIGGMGNVTIIPPSSAGPPSYSAFDTGPGNVLIDAAVRIISDGQKHYDKDGEMAKTGSAGIDKEYVEKWIHDLHYLHRSPPKTTGRELFSDDMASKIVKDLKGKGISDNGVIATITFLTAETIVRAYQDFVISKHGDIDEIFICGGGADNPMLIDHIQERFSKSSVKKLNEVSKSDNHSAEGDGKGGMGIPADAKEAILFAVIGFLCVCGRDVPIAGNEKNREPGIMGKITPGKNYHNLMEKVLVQDRNTSTLGIIHAG